MRKKIKIKPICKHENTQFQFLIENTKVIEDYLIINGVTTMYGICPDCNKEVNEIAIGGLFQIEYPKGKQNKTENKNKGIKQIISTEYLDE